MNNLIIKIRALNICNTKNIVKFNLKNASLLLSLFIPLTISATFELSNIMHLIGVVFMLLAIFVGFTFRIGSDSDIYIFYDKIQIKSSLGSQTFFLNEIKEINTSISTGLNPPFVIEIYLKNKDKKVFLIDKFSFQNTRKIYKSIKEISQ